MSDATASTEPPLDCPACPRLVEYRVRNQAAWPDWHNAPVPSWGPNSARLLIVGLAPGLKGANCTGRPFTGDYAGDLLYETLDAHGYARGEYGARPDDGLRLVDCRITNAVRCVPPQNKPIAQEIAACRPYLTAPITAMPDLRVVLALGRIAHDNVLTAMGERRAGHPFGHCAVHELDGFHLVDSYHCSRYNTNPGRLTPDMFNRVFSEIRRIAGPPRDDRPSPRPS